MEATFEIFIEWDIIFKFFCTLWHTWIGYPNGTYFRKYVPFGYLIHVCHNVQKKLKIISHSIKISNVASIIFFKYFSSENAVKPKFWYHNCRYFCQCAPYPKFRPGFWICSKSDTIPHIQIFSRNPQKKLDYALTTFEKIINAWNCFLFEQEVKMCLPKACLLLDQCNRFFKNCNWPKKD